MSISISASTEERAAVVLSRGWQCCWWWPVRVLRNAEPQPLPKTARDGLQHLLWAVPKVLPAPRH